MNEHPNGQLQMARMEPKPAAAISLGNVHFKTVPDRSIRRWWLCVPPFLFGLVDHAITLWYQPAQYWSGDYMMACEANPLFEWLMQIHPLAFEAGSLGWVILFGMLILKLPRILARMTSLCLTVGHTFGAASWLTWCGEDYYWINIGMAVACGAVVSLCFEAAGEC
jgi:hypothetical protein